MFRRKCITRSYKIRNCLDQTFCSRLIIKNLSSRQSAFIMVKKIHRERPRPSYIIDGLPFSVNLLISFCQFGQPLLSIPPASSEHHPRTPTRFQSIFKELRLNNCRGVTASRNGGLRLWCVISYKNHESFCLFLLKLALVFIHRFNYRLIVYNISNCRYSYCYY